MKKLIPFLVIACTLSISQNTTAAPTYCQDTKASDTNFEVAFVPAQTVAEVVAVVAKELLNLK